MAEANFVGHERQQEVNSCLCWLVLATCLGLENRCFGAWCLSITDVMASNGVRSKNQNKEKKRNINSRLLSVLRRVAGFSEGVFVFI